MMHTTRESWLNAAVVALHPIFAEHGYTVPQVKVSCSWPGGGSARKRIGECWPTKASAADVNEVFISPTLDDPVRVLDVLAHELAHAVDNCQNGHKAPFVKIVRAIGLEGKPTATVAGPDLRLKLETVVLSMGAYPHSKVNINAARKKDTVRQIKRECSACGAIWRMSRQWIDAAEHGMWCPVCGEVHHRTP